MEDENDDKYIGGHDEFLQEEEEDEKNEDSHIESEELIPGRRRKGARGATQMKNVIKNRSKGKLGKIEYNDKGQPYDEENINFQSYLGVLARSHIPISMKNWNEVDQETKEHIWHIANVRTTYHLFNSYVLSIIFISFYINKQ